MHYKELFLKCPFWQFAVITKFYENSIDFFSLFSVVLDNKFTLAGKKAAKLKVFARRLRPLSRVGALSCHTCRDMGPRSLPPPPPAFPLYDKQRVLGTSCYRDPHGRDENMKKWGRLLRSAMFIVKIFKLINSY